jgi:hypothetical protein
MAAFLIKLLLKFFCGSKTAMVSSSLLRPLMFFFPPHLLILGLIVIYFIISIPMLFTKIPFLKFLSYKKNEQGEYNYSLLRHIISVSIISWFVYYILLFLLYLFATKVLCYVHNQFL